MVEEPVIVTHENGRRFVRLSKGRELWIETYCLSSSQRLEQLFKTLSQVEIRRMLDAEWKKPRRRSTLLRLTGRLCKLDRDEKIASIKSNVASKSRTGYPRRPRMIPLEVEAAAMRTFEPRLNKSGGLVERYANGSSYRSTLTKTLRARRREFEAAALAGARAEGRSRLTKREREELRKQAGDHFHEGLVAGELCELCNEVIGEIS